jgi:transposase
MLSKEKILERRLEREPEKKRNRRNKIRKQTCNCCGVPKSYVCLEHNDYLDIPKVIKRRKFWKQFRLNSIRKKVKGFFFSFGRKLKVVE